jgi:integrase
MPRRVPSYRCHKPSGQAVVTLDGRDHYLGRHGSAESRRAYDRLVAEYLATRARRTAAAAPPADLTVNELLLRYWEHARSYYVKDGRPTSEPETIRQALRPVRELYGDTPARDFGPLALKAVRGAMIERGWCRTYINKQVDRVRRMFAWAAENELVSVAVYHALKTVAGLRKDRSEAREKPPVGPVPDELVEKTLSRLSPTVAAMVRVQRLTGMRPQEVILMRGADIDRADPACWVYRPSRHKAQHHDRERLVYLGPRAQAILAPFLVTEPTGYLFSPRRAEAQRRAEERAGRARPAGTGHPSRLRGAPKRSPGEVYDGGAYRKAIRRACQKLGLPIWYPHQIRHSAATEFRRRYGLEVTQALLGHRELGVTQVYAEVDRQRARSVMAEGG